MRNLQTTISTIVRQGNQLIVRGEVLRSLCARSLAALAFYASRHWPNVMCGVKPRMQFAVVKPGKRRHNTTCPRTIA